MIFPYTFGLLVLIVYGATQISEINAATPSYRELENLTAQQRAALQKFKTSVSPILPHDYMKEDVYLVKWMQVQAFNPRHAEIMLREALKWRSQNQVESWNDIEKFPEFEREFPTFLDGYDREGRPILERFFGEWNVRRTALAGKMKQLVSYAVAGIERANTKIRKQQVMGKNVTEWILLLNMEGFTVVNQACPACLPLYLGFVHNYDKYYPNSVFKAIFINTPPSFEIVLNLVRPIMQPQTRAALKVFGANGWKQYLDDLIEPEEISNWYDERGKDRKSP